MNPSSVGPLIKIFKLRYKVTDIEKIRVICGTKA